MLSTKLTIARLSALLSGGLLLGYGLGQAATARNAKTVSPTAVATAADVEYCFDRVRGLNPERLPQAYLVLRLHVTVSYLNEGSRPVILPLEHVRTLYTALKPGQMSVFKQGLGLLDSDMKVMDHLPPDVGPDSPIDPKNDVFAVIPAGGQLTPPLEEEIKLPVDRKGVFRKYPDLRGKRVYVKLRYAHRKLDPALEANLSDRWSRFGVPWTGTLTTNTILIDVPAAPHGEPCKDNYTPAHPVVGDDDKK
ncbi:MAG: hypothetical protein ACLPWF_23795 [Bryobacteraceae bacterium]